MTTPVEVKQFSRFTDENLLAVKSDLEQRLAKFQKAFFEKHGRNPTELEREPARPAIMRYRAVCKELANRENAAMEEDDEEEEGTAGVNVAEQVATQGQVLATTADSGSELVRDATRAADRNRASISKANEGAQAAISGGAAESSVGVVGKFATLARTVMPSAAMTDLLVSWGQFTAIWGDITSSVTDKLPDASALAPWAETMRKHVWPYLSIFNMDIHQLQLSFDLSFLDSIGWRDMHLGFTVLIPLIISGITILLLRSLGDIARLLLFTVSVLLLIFGASAYAILGIASYIRGEETAQILDLNSQTLGYVVATGGTGLFISILLFFYRLHLTHKKIRDYLQIEVDDLAAKLYGVKEGLAASAELAKKGKGGLAASASSKNVHHAHVQEGLPNASLLTSMLEEDEDTDHHLVGGRAKNSAEFLRQMDERAAVKKHGFGPRMPKFSSFVKTLVLWVLLTAGALFLWLRYAHLVPPAVIEALPDTYITTYYVLAIFCTTFAVIILMYELLVLTKTGLHILESVFQLLKAAYIGFLMVMVSFLYIPISRQALQIFICEQKDCAQGEWFPLQSPGSEASLWTYLTQFASAYLEAANSISIDAAYANVSNVVTSIQPAETCEACHFLGADRHLLSGAGGGNVGACPAGLAQQLCPPSSSVRLTAAPQIDCHQQWAFYIPGVLLTLLMFTVGVPYMFYNLTHRHTQMYEDLEIYAGDKTLKRSAIHRHHRFLGGGARHGAAALYTNAELEDLWRRRVRRAGRNRAKTLYADFSYSMRFWKLVLLGMKFLIVVVDVLTPVLGHPAVAPSLMLSIHVCMLLLTTFSTPYYDHRPGMLSIAISFANVFNWCLLVATALNVAAPPYMIYLIVLFNLVLPILSLFVGWYLNVRRQKVSAARLAEKTKQRRYIPLAEVQKKRRTVERHINEFTLRLLASWTWGVLIASVVSGELIFIGTFAEAALTPVLGPTAASEYDAGRDVPDCYREDFAKAQEFLSFGSWREFTDNCCCMSRSNVTSSLELETHLTELWSCSNHLAATERERQNRPVIYKERQRRPMEAGTTVSVVRPFRGTVFRDRHGVPQPSLEPIFDEQTGRMGIQWYEADGSVFAFFDNYW